MSVLRLLLVVLLALPVWADSPEDVVRRLYQTHLSITSQKKTVEAVPECFTPGFLGILERAYRRRPPDAFVDVDVFSNSQGGFGDFEVGRATITGQDAVVPLTLWVGRGKERKNLTKTQARVFLTDVGEGHGFQIRDLEFLPNERGGRLFRIREWLVPIADGKR